MRVIGCDECERDFAEGAEIVVAFEDDAGLHALPLTYCPALADLRLSACSSTAISYEVARLKEPPLPPLGGSAELPGLRPRRL